MPVDGLLNGERSAQRERGGDDGVLLLPVTPLLYHRFALTQLSFADRSVIARQVTNDERQTTNVRQGVELPAYIA
jgi:hypothetical protein